MGTVQFVWKFVVVPTLAVMALTAAFLLVLIVAFRSPGPEPSCPNVCVLSSVGADSVLSPGVPAR